MGSDQDYGQRKIAESWTLARRIDVPIQRILARHGSVSGPAVTLPTWTAGVVKVELGQRIASAGMPILSVHSDRTGDTCEALVKLTRLGGHLIVRGAGCAHHGRR